MMYQAKPVDEFFQLVRDTIDQAEIVIKDGKKYAVVPIKPWNKLKHRSNYNA